jgi:T-complex protein 1 subunit zeta
MLIRVFLSLQDAIRDGLRALFNAIQDGCVVPGAGAFELAVSKRLDSLQIASRSVLGVKVMAKAILVIPKVLVANSGHDSQDTVLKALQTPGDTIVGLNLDTGDTLLPTQEGILDLYIAKKQIIDARYYNTFHLLMFN